MSFVCALLEHNRQAFLHWQRLVDILLRCDEAICAAGGTGAADAAIGASGAVSAGAGKPSIGMHAASAGTPSAHLCTASGQPTERWFLLAWKALAEQLLELPEEVVLGPFAGRLQGEDRIKGGKVEAGDSTSKGSSE